jgi:uncharacterized protein YecE (DUF72 family)
MTFHTGTCSWAEKTLIESHEFYPADAASAEQRLKYYASHFDTVEVDSAFYAIPRPQNAVLWSSRTPDGFIFHIKAYGALTGHGIMPKTLPMELRSQLSGKDRGSAQTYINDPTLLSAIGSEFARVLTPLKDAGKLGLIVFQFPPWFRYSSRNLEDIFSRSQLVGGLPVAVEFRHGSWLVPERREPVLTFLRDHKLTYVTADEPQYGSLDTVPLFPAVTTDIAYFRLHGRNRETWLKAETTAERFAYRYSDEELDEINSIIKTIAPEAKDVFVMFNNHGSPGIQNARKMKMMISGRK